MECGAWWPVILQPRQVVFPATALEMYQTFFWHFPRRMGQKSRKNEHGELLTFGGEKVGMTLLGHTFNDHRTIGGPSWDHWLSLAAGPGLSTWGRARGCLGLSPRHQSPGTPWICRVSFFSTGNGNHRAMENHRSMGHLPQLCGITGGCYEAYQNCGIFYGFFTK